ncbi:MAG: hypothetical protein Q7T71_04150, partial [Herbiconiux sp.]|nr:hypothetical protein [Herbiconiux sp.]
AGGIKGRAPIDEVGAYASLPVPEMLTALAGIDACGVVVDRAAFADGGAALIGEIEAATGRASGTFDSADGRFSFLEVSP